VSSEIEIGKGKRGRRAYSLDDIAIVPARRTRDPEDVSLKWQIDAYQFDLPFIGAPMDSAMSPETVIALGRFGGLGVLDLEGLWTRYEDPTPLLAEIAQLPSEMATSRMQELYSAPIQAELITARLEQIREAGVTVAGALTPQRTQEFYKTVVDAGVDIFVIRGTTVSAEHVSTHTEPLNLKQFIYELDVPVIVGGAATYTAALHLMRTGAAGVLVGFGGGAAATTRRTLGIHAPMATAVADVHAARRDYMDESGGRYVPRHRRWRGLGPRAAISSKAFGVGRRPPSCSAPHWLGRPRAPRSRDALGAPRPHHPAAAARGPPSGNWAPSAASSRCSSVPGRTAIGELKPRPAPLRRGPWPPTGLPRPQGNSNASTSTVSPYQSRLGGLICSAWR
jgi:IMP dehydrogenase